MTLSTTAQPQPIKPPQVPRLGRGGFRGKRPTGVRKELSAGGVVVREENGTWLVALLKTEHKRGVVWVLPKGHVELDANEGVADAAKREVQEEAGIADLVVKNQLGVTRFRFQAETAVVYKTVHYFLMTTTQLELTPQADEGLLDAAWFPIEQAITELEYDTDQEIVRRAHDILTGKPRRRSKPTSRRRGGPSTSSSGSRGGRQVRIRT